MDWRLKNESKTMKILLFIGIAFFRFISVSSAQDFINLLHHAQHELEQQQYVKAFQALSEAYDLSTDQSQERIEVLIALGHFYAKVGGFGDAEGCFRKALQINPYEFSALMGLGDIHFRRKEFLNARHAYERARKYHPKQAQVYAAIATTFYEKAQTMEAAHYYQKALALDPDDIFSWNNLGIIYYGKLQFAEALKSWQTALKLDKQSQILHNNLAILFRDLGKPALSELHFRHAMGTASDDPAVLSNYANLLFDKRKTEQAKHYLRLAKQKDSSPVYSNNLAVMERFTGEILGAGVQYSQTLEQARFYSNARFHSRFFERRSQKIREALHGSKE